MYINPISLFTFPQYYKSTQFSSILNLHSHLAFSSFYFQKIIMEKITLSLILFLFMNIFIFSFVGAVKGTSSVTQPRANKLVEAQCRSTRYPKLCVSSLSNYITTTSEPQELAHVALKVSLAKAIYTRAYVKNVCKQLEKTKSSKDYQAVKECLNQISDGVSLLFNSVKELHHLSLDKESEFVWHRSNVQTWLSTVLTNAFTCMDGISSYKLGGYKVKATIKAKVLNVAQVTSNALALFNGYAVRHKDSHHSNSGKINKP
ncbi:hypothetical protein CQW23_01491 [Capsicum baccatum]|uniref:Pectinesterase inhibitor domain-containing protein n=1 Tax=Capsicum baccatum TaxID=33114 RepID=A0A2G2XNS0_CAPBA|nr:hypothetical protein CQW23_01491 [Capsicum baccatum]